jgi:hypothetical protein
MLIILRVLVGIFFLNILFPFCGAMRQMMVIVTVADLCALNEKTNQIHALSLEDLCDQHRQDLSIYCEAPSTFCRDNPRLLSQLLFGERVLAEPVNDDWCRVYAVEQKIFCSNKWIPCPGFIRTSCLDEIWGGNGACLVVARPWAFLYKKEQKISRVLKLLPLGARLSGVKKSCGWWTVETPLGKGVIATTDVMTVNDGLNKNTELLRAGVVDAAKQFMGGPYTWGGGCSWLGHALRYPKSLKNQITGVDCSGLIKLAFRSQGLCIPRNSHDQWLSTVPVKEGRLMQSGDLIFFADYKQRFLRVSHVVMYVGQDAYGGSIILESNGKIKPFGVRMMPTKKHPRFQEKSLRDLRSGQVVSWFFGGQEIKEVIYFGSFFTKTKLQALRREFLHCGNDQLNEKK